MAWDEFRAESTEDARSFTRYPYYSLDKALDELGKAVFDLGGASGDVSRAQIAKRLGMPPNSPNLIGMIGAAKLYQLILGIGGTYTLTPVGRAYFNPASTDNDRQLALLRMVNGPPLFAQLIDKFDNDWLPTNERLVEVVENEHGIAKSWQSRAVSLFISSLRKANVIDAAGFLRFRATLEALSNKTGETASPPSLGSAGPGHKPDKAPTGEPKAAGIAVWQFQGIRVESPEEMTMAQWKKLCDYVNVLKPD